METRLTTRGLALGALLLLSATSTATAHEHHMDNIAEGQAVSDDPIVGACSVSSGRCSS